ncbi:hypothetical protein B9Z19DRAFT_240996 [Tuber borchii]|uniref:Uncharacterized protein n=1 Tax=Tuber borchii TaxID=42251 RepID=A0A2T6ZMA6_TUBBO|nr:hypothetical protein B9Z19DRAFT_240996 [Tuber borchii]
MPFFRLTMQQKDPEKSSRRGSPVIDKVIVDFTVWGLRPIRMKSARRRICNAVDGRGTYVEVIITAFCRQVKLGLQLMAVQQVNVSAIVRYYAVPVLECYAVFGLTRSATVNRPGIVAYHKADCPLTHCSYRYRYRYLTFSLSLSTPPLLLHMPFILHNYILGRKRLQPVVVGFFFLFTRIVGKEKKKFAKPPLIGEKKERKKARLYHTVVVF